MAFTKEFKFTVEYQSEAHAAVCADISDVEMGKTAQRAIEWAERTAKKDGWHGEALWIGYRHVGSIWRKVVDKWSRTLPGWYGRVGDKQNGPHKLKGDAKKWVESQVAAKAGE